MVETIRIQNFKSVVDVSLELGTFNVLIGENGCGKSNILEGIAFGAAAAANKLDYEFLGSRGIRVANPEFMYSAFASTSKKVDLLRFKIVSETHDNEYTISHDPKNPMRWRDKGRESLINGISEFFSHVGNNPNNRAATLKSLPKDDRKGMKAIFEMIDLNPDYLGNLESLWPHIIREMEDDPTWARFIGFSPEQSSLRRFEDSTQLYPLGIKGEGLFQYLKRLAFDKKNNKILAEIKENLQLLDWYEDFRLPENLMRNEYSLQIKDRYLDEKLQYFDQRSTNEGFLFLLFYLTLFISKDTPPFFAIDNIDASFNPKMCMQLTKTLVKLAKKHKKQVIVTTHNPAILDGLNLKDDKQRLFVVRRNDDGHTVVRRILHRPEREMRLSEAWTNGFIGGLPDNF